VKAFADEYRRLQVLQLYTNKLWSTTNILFETVFITGACLALYGAVKLQGARAFQQLCVGIFGVSMLINLLRKMSLVYETSVELREGSKGMFQSKWFRQFVRSSPPDEDEHWKFLLRGPGAHSHRSAGHHE